MRSTKLILFSIFTFSFILRIYLLDKIPNSISGDEAAFGYNAYSILKTGKDEFGYKYPLSFRSFDDYKNPVFGYALIPFIVVLDLTEWSIRFPSVIAGTGVVLLFFFITRKLSSDTKLSLMATFLAAISPWLIQYSRVAIEGEFALFLTLFGLFLFLKGKEKNIYYIFSAVVWGLAFYTYYSSKVWILLFVPYLLLIGRKINRYLILGIVMFTIMILPYFYLLKTTNIGLRSYAISVFADQTQIQKDINLMAADWEKNIHIGKFIHNRRLTFLNQALSGYLKILSPEILFAQSGYNQISSTRLLYLWQLPLISLGIIFLLRNKNLFLFVVIWLLIGFLPGGLTALPVFDRRILLNSYPLIILTSIGFINLIRRILKDAFWGKLILVLLLTSSFYLYLHNYFIHGQNEVVYLWGNGMKEVVWATQKEKKNYGEVVVSMKLNAPLTYFLFYGKYPPEKYLQEGGTISGGFMEEVNRFDKYSFKFLRKEDLKQNVLYVWNINEATPELFPLHTIFASDGKPMAQIGVYQPK
jgi:4-amino-4-deoxy-L-arabinose transferase-like glycosyltransferase